jgi:hypothetical protein
LWCSVMCFQASLLSSSSKACKWCVIFHSIWERVSSIWWCRTHRVDMYIYVLIYEYMYPFSWLD